MCAARAAAAAEGLLLFARAFLGLLAVFFLGFFLFGEEEAEEVALADEEPGEGAGGGSAWPGDAGGVGVLPLLCARACEHGFGA